MKTCLISLTLISAAASMAAPNGIICREDLRMQHGTLRESFLTPSDGYHTLQIQRVLSLNDPSIKIDTLAEKLNCRVDEKSAVAFCQNTAGQSVQINEVRKVFFESLDAEKKTAQKRIEITLFENGTEKKVESFNASNCDVFGGEA